MPSAAIKAYLEENKIPFKVTEHPVAFTAQEVAAEVHVSGYRLAKVVVIKADGKFVMAALPAPMRVDLELFRKVSKAKKVELAREEEFESLFPGCDRGAMPPFGNLYKLPVFVDRTLAEHDRIVFNAGSHVETIQVAYADFERLVKPKIGAFSGH